jgi:hypothetical protein
VSCRENEERQWTHGIKLKTKNKEGAVDFHKQVEQTNPPKARPMKRSLDERGTEKLKTIKAGAQCLAKGNEKHHWTRGKLVKKCHGLHKQVEQTNLPKARPMKKSLDVHGTEKLRTTEAGHIV